MSITAANAIVMLSVFPLFPVPVQLQRFAADDVFDVDDIEPNEVLMGVDGHQSAGRVNVSVPWTVKLMADSLSCPIFDQWNAAEFALQDTFPASGIVTLKSIGSKWSMNNGSLTRFKPMPDAKKLLGPRAFRITWESVLPAPL